MHCCVWETTMNLCWGRTTHLLAFPYLPCVWEAWQVMSSLSSSSSSSYHHRIIIIIIIISLLPSSSKMSSSYKCISTFSYLPHIWESFFFFNNYVFCFLSIIIYLFIIIMYLQFHALILICLPLRDCIHISWHQNNLSKLLTFSFTLTFLFIKLIFSKLIYITFTFFFFNSLLRLQSFSKWGAFWNGSNFQGKSRLMEMCHGPWFYQISCDQISCIVRSVTV